jgi:hypothetical protein
MASATIIRLFIASPGDVADARSAVLNEIVPDLNNTWGLRHDIILQTLDWRANVTPWLGKPPEPTILQQIPVNKWDLFIGILWSRFGTPTGSTNPQTNQPFQSGTEEEFTLAYQSNQSRGVPQMLLYRCLAPVKPDQIDPTQLQLVQDFFKQFQYGGPLFGLYSTYQTVDEFKRLVRQHLDSALREVWLGQKP